MGGAAMINSDSGRVQRRETTMLLLVLVSFLASMMVVYGNASGPVPPFDIGQLAAKGSLFLTRPTLATYTAKRDDLIASANDLFDVVEKGIVKIEINQRFPLAEAAAAHTALEARKTTGSTLLMP